MMFGLGDLAAQSVSDVATGSGPLPICASTADASYIGCVVVPCQTKGTLCQSTTPLTNLWAGQEVIQTQQAVDAYKANTQAAAAAGGVAFSSADNGSAPMAGGAGGAGSSGSTTETTAATETAATQVTPETVAVLGGIGLIVLLAMAG